MRVPCAVRAVELENDTTRPIHGVRVTCSRCGAGATCHGTGDRSTRRALALLRRGCPRAEENFYAAAPMEECDS